MYSTTLCSTCLEGIIAIAHIVGAAFSTILAMGEVPAEPEIPCTDRNPKTIEAHCDLKVRLECDHKTNMCKPVFYWVAKLRQHT